MGPGPTVRPTGVCSFAGVSISRLYEGIQTQWFMEGGRDAGRNRIGGTQKGFMGKLSWFFTEPNKLPFFKRKICHSHVPTKFNLIFKSIQYGNILSMSPLPWHESSFQSKQLTADSKLTTLILHVSSHDAIHKTKEQTPLGDRGNQAWQV